jgi:hypothetical protein
MHNDKSITVQRDIPAAATDIFDVLTNPHRHAELDGPALSRASTTPTGSRRLVRPSG